MTRRRIINNRGNTALKDLILDGGGVSFGRHDTLGGHTMHWGAPYVDVFGGGEYLAASQLPDALDGGGAVRQFFSPEASIELTGGPSDPARFNVADKRSRRWVSLDNKVVCWEVGAGAQVVFLGGRRVPLEPVLGVGGTIRAACLRTPTTVRVLRKGPDNSFVVSDISGVTSDTPVLKASYPTELPFTETTWKDSDVSHLYSAFLAPSRLVTVEVYNNRSDVVLYRLTDGAFKRTRVVESLRGMTATASMSCHRNNPVLSVLAGGVPSTNTLISHTVTNQSVSINDNVVMTGERIVACNSDGASLALLIEDVNTTCHRVVNRPPYSQSETYWLAVRPIFQGPWVVATWYDSSLTLGGYDSGKLSETWTRSSANSYRRRLIQIGGDTDDKDTITEKPAFSGGTYSATTAFHERYAMFSYNASWLSHPVVPPLTDIIAAVQGNIYSETKDTYHRTFNNAVKIYAADPLAEVYMYQTMTGGIVDEFMSFDSRGFAAPAPEDLPLPVSYTTTLRFCLRKGDVETVVGQTPVTAATEVGLQKAHRPYLNYEPTMPYFTQPQPPVTGPVVPAVVRNQTHTVNKSINLCFDGRYLATDMTKTAAVAGLTRDDDRPTIEFPGLNDQRYRYFTNAAIASHLNVLRRFHEAYRPCSNRNTASLSDGSYGLDFRMSDDRHRLACSSGLWTDEVDLQPSAVLVDWADIRGWGDFLLRGGFGVWDTPLSFFYTSGPAPTEGGAVLPTSVMDVL